MVFSLSTVSIGQLSINCGYQISESWISIPIELSKDFGKHSVILGVGFGSNSKLIYEHNNVFRRQFYGESFSQRLSFQMGYEYKFMGKNRSWYPSLFYRFIANRAPTRSRVFFPAGLDDQGNPIFRRTDVYLKTMNMFENYLGFKVHFRLFPKVYYFQSVGAGFFIVNDLDPRLGRENDGDVGFDMAWGISYKITE